MPVLVEPPGQSSAGTAAARYRRPYGSHVLKAVTTTIGAVPAEVHVHVFYGEPLALDSRGGASRHGGPPPVLDDVGSFPTAAAAAQAVTRIAVGGDEREPPGLPSDPMDYDALRELVNELRAEYLARKRRGHDDRERRRWFDASVKLQDQLHEVDPFDAVQVSALRGELVETLRTLRS